MISTSITTAWEVHILILKINDVQMVILVDYLLSPRSFIVGTFAPLISAVAALLIFYFETFFVGSFWKLFILRKLGLFPVVFLLLLSKETETALAGLVPMDANALVASIRTFTAVLVSYLELLPVVDRANFPWIVFAVGPFWVKANSLCEFLLFILLRSRAHAHIIGAAVLILINVISHCQTPSSNRRLVIIATNKFRLDFHLHFLGKTGQTFRFLEIVMFFQNVRLELVG
jgi:hypothetical protein